MLFQDLYAPFISAEQVPKPRLKGKPVIVGKDPKRHGIIVLVYYVVRPFGIHVGMLAYKKIALLRSHKTLDCWIGYLRH